MKEVEREDGAPLSAHEPIWTPTERHGEARPTHRLLRQALLRALALLLPAVGILHALEVPWTSLEGLALLPALAGACALLGSAGALELWTIRRRAGRRAAALGAAGVFLLSGAAVLQVPLQHEYALGVLRSGAPLSALTGAWERSGLQGPGLPFAALVLAASMGCATLLRWDRGVEALALMGAAGLLSTSLPPFGAPDFVVRLVGFWLLACPLGAAASLLQWWADGLELRLAARAARRARGGGGAEA